MKKTKIRESTFVNEFRKACKELDFYFYKIPDAYNMERFSPAKPYDAFVLGEYGKFTAIEFKMHKTPTGFPFDKVKDHQIKGLIEVEEAGAKSLIIINYRWHKHNVAYYMSPYTFLDLKEGFSNRKSIPYEAMQAMSIIERSKIFSIKSNKDILMWDIASMLWSS